MMKAVTKKMITGDNHSTIRNMIVASIVLLLTSTLSKAQQQFVVKVSPAINASINGQLELDRQKYFNLATSADQIARKISDQSRFDDYFKGMEITVGRQLGMVFAETRWGNSLREDDSRPGFMDVNYFKSKKTPSDNMVSQLVPLFGKSQSLAVHDRHDGFPDFMDQYTVEGEKYPTNNEAAAEIIANVLKYQYTSFQRPSFYELVNEPHWKLWGDSRFAQFHTKAKAKVAEMGLSTQVGGPCYSVSDFYRNEYRNLSQITNFIDNTGFKLDFYSFHSYDYMKWSDSANDFVGSITSGLPLEGVIDAVASYTYNKHGKAFKYVSSEHGGYITNPDNREYALNKLADENFPGSGFEHEMQKRTIDNFIMVNSAIANTMVFMNHPHIVQKSVPFILLESAGWNPEYYSSLLVKENFDKNSSVWAEARLIDFYKYFSDVKGRRIESFTADSDIQQMSFVDGNELMILLHNQSNESGTFDVVVDDIGNPIEEIVSRRLSRADDFRPVLEETVIASLNQLPIGPQESIVLFVKYKDDIAKEDEVDEIAYYSKETATQFRGKKTFDVRIPNHQKAKYGILRVGISTNSTGSSSKNVSIKLNGTKLVVPVEDCADRITQAGRGYFTTKIIKVDGRFLKENNKVEVQFPGSISAGVGSVIIRAAIMDTDRIDTITSIEDGVDQTFKIYPNPNHNGRLNIRTDKSGRFQVINITGKVVLSSEMEAGTNAIKIGDLAKGSYFIQLRNDDGVKSQKLMIN